SAANVKIARFSNLGFIEPRIRPKSRASSSRRPRLPGGFVRLSRCFCKSGRSSRLGRSMSGKESGIGCYLHKLKGCSKTIAGDASDAAPKVERSENYNRDAQSQGKQSLDSADHNRQGGRYDGCDNDGFCAEPFHEFRSEALMGIAVEISHRQ